MALHPCPECQKDVSDKAPACPHCGMPLLARPAVAVGVGSPAPPLVARWKTLLGLAVAIVLALMGVGALALWLRRPDYSRVEQLRAEQDAEGTRDEHVRQRFFRLYKGHPHNAMFIYLWARCVDDAAQQLDLAEQGIRADPSFAWSYNMAARALARLNRIPEAYDQAVKGASLDPANIQLADKQRSLRLILDHKLTDQRPPVPSAYSSYEGKESFEKGAVRYQGLFRALIRSPDRADLQAMEKSRLPDYKNPIADAVRGFVVCANPFADACIRAYVPRDARFETVWPHPDADVGAFKEHQLVTVAGSVVSNGKGENILLADAITVETP